MCAFCMPIGLGHSLASTSGILAGQVVAFFLLVDSGAERLSDNPAARALKAAGHPVDLFRHRQRNVYGERFGVRMSLRTGQVFSRQEDANQSVLQSNLACNISKGPLEHRGDVLRLAASFKQGTVNASLMLRKPGSYPRRNNLPFLCRSHTRHSICLRYRIRAMRVGAITPLGKKSKPDSPGMRPCVPYPLPREHTMGAINAKGDRT